MNRIRIVATVALGVFLLAACGGGGSGPSTTPPAPEPEAPRPPPQTSDTPEFHLGTARFTTHQPYVLEQVGAHHAYARGLTGRGVRIGIDDTIVDYTQTAEFGNRVKLRDADGADLLYWHPLGDEPFSEVDRCRRNSTCTVWRGNSQDDDDAHNRWVQQIVEEDGWPTRDDSVFILDESFSLDGTIGEYYRWWEVPTPYGTSGSHGTAVASVAAGTSLGVAPEATIIPTAKNLSDDQFDEDVAAAYVLRAIAALPNADRRQIDDELAGFVREDYAKFDIINRSYGTPVSEFAVVYNIETARWFSAYLPQTLNAVWQTDRPDAEKTIVVYAAGNDGDPVPGLGALLPYGFPELRGHSLAVVATDPSTGTIAGYSNRCGPLPSDWNAARHGRHYCLAAPGTARALLPDANNPGSGRIGEVSGTSIAAPVVSGALALLKEHFRGTRGNTAIVRRIIDTASRSGRYSDLETYGAGHLNIAAALSPVGSLSAGQSARPLTRTALQTPAAFGSVAQRAASIELAAFDNQDFPFWVPVSGLVSPQSDGRSPIPQFADTEQAGAPTTGLGALGLHWAALEDAGGLPFLSGDREWVMGLGATSTSLARLPHENDWGYGFSFDNAGYLGTQTSGAFGSDLRSGMIWASRAYKRELGEALTLNVEGTLAYSLPQYEDDAIFAASPSVMSATSIRIGTGSTGITIEQPLRAETGTGTFRVENGRIENGRRLYDVYRVPLRPDAREIRMSLRHERQALGGNIAVEVGHSMNAGHVPGETETGVGLAYRMNW